MIDLRSDTATRPTDGMRAAIAAAAVGDEQRREDPTVNELQARVAALLGQDSALFLPTATLANQIALKLHSRPGDVLLAEQHAHVVIYEYGGAAAHAGLMVEPIAGRHGRFGVEELVAATEPSTKAADQRATVLALGIRRLQHTVVHTDTPQIRGMVFKVRHLVRVEETK